jgi:small-conductance mechanosensitive channel
VLTYLDWSLYANPVRNWLAALLVASLAFASLRLVTALVLRSLVRLSARTTTHMDDLIADVVRSTRGWFMVVVALSAGSLPLFLPDRLRDLVQQLTVLALLCQLGVWGRVAIRSQVEHYSARKLEEDAAGVTTVRALGFLATLVLGSVLVLMALANLGVDITALVAGLGIGGVAIALAVQSILGDLFASLSIVLDKPFVYGDFIVVDDLKGTVEHVGLKTTRLRSLSGEQLVFSNSDLLGSRIRNFKRMYERRVEFSVGVVYQTPAHKLERIPGLLRGIVEAHPDLRFDRAHLKELGASSLNFELVYFVLGPEYNLFMDRQQAICLETFRRFDEEEIEFAYPTQTLFLARENGADGGSRGGWTEDGRLREARTAMERRT